MGFNELSKLWFLALLIPVIIFYFLKLKRPKIKVSSLFLWQQTLDDKRVNSPFQRFKRHLLLLLQLLILAFLVLAAADPYFTGNINKAKRIPIIIDISASMGALDKPGGTSRLEKAKEKIKKLINNKVSGQEFAIITFSDRAHKICGFTDNVRVLNDAINRIKLKDLPANIEDALRMVQAISKNFNFSEAILFSDGNFPSKNNFTLSFKLNFQKISTPASNIGITALTAQRSGSRHWVIFAELTSTGASNAAALELYHNGKLLGEETYVPGKNNSERISFTVPGEMASSLKLQLKPDGFDALTTDNTAYITLPQLRPLQVYISPSLKSIKAAMRGIKEVNLYPEKNPISASITPANSYDLAVTDRETSISPDTKLIFSSGLIPNDLRGVLRKEKKDIAVMDWIRDDPLLQHTQLNELSIMEGTAFRKGSSAKNLEKLGYQTVIFGSPGPLLLKKERADQISYSMLFDISKSTLPFRIAFPIMIKNLVELARKKAGLSDITADRTGILPIATLLPNSNYTITTPDQRTITERTDDDGRLPAVAAPLTGVYTISRNNKTIRDIGVSLLCKSETLLYGTDKIKFSELSVKASGNSATTPLSIWKYLAVLALIILCTEWWLFNKHH